MVPVGELESCESLATKACRGGAGFRRGISQEVHLPAILLKYHTAGLGAVSPANALELSRQKLHNSKFGANTRGIGPAARETLAPNPNSKVPSTVMTAIGMYVRDSSLKHARELAAVAIPAAPRARPGVAKRGRSRCWCDLERSVVVRRRNRREARCGTRSLRKKTVLRPGAGKISVAMCGPRKTRLYVTGNMRWVVKRARPGSGS